MSFLLEGYRKSFLHKTGDKNLIMDFDILTLLEAEKELNGEPEEEA